MKRPRVSRIATAVLLASACLGHAGDAQAEDAEPHLTRGVELREQGRDEEALGEFRRAYALSPTPRARAQIALAEQALGTWLAAEQDLTEALRASADPWITKNQQPLRDALGTIGQHLGTLELRLEPATVRGGDVIVDGERRGSVPLDGPLRVEAGRRTLEVRATGYYATSRAVVVPPGGFSRETITLHPQEVAAAPSAPTTRPTATSGGARDIASPSAKPGGGSALTTVGWVFLGTSVALLATGIVGQVVRQSNITSYNNDPTCPGQGSATQPPSCGDLVRSGQTWNTVSIVSFIGGGVFASSGLVLLLVGSSIASPSAGPHTAGLHCGPFGCAGTF